MIKSAAEIKGARFSDLNIKLFPADTKITKGSIKVVPYLNTWYCRCFSCRQVNPEGQPFKDLFCVTKPITLHCFGKAYSSPRVDKILLNIYRRSIKNNEIL